jgi:HEAT repeats/PBS lyase HEAT-like repeat
VVEVRQINSSRATGWRISVTAIPVLAVLSITGCAGFWDDVTSRDFKVKSLFVQPDPLLVLQTSTDGDARAKAMRALKEPISHGGTQADQDEIMKILTAAAVSDKQPICRLAAMQALGRFKDPRAATALVDSFYRANSFSTDTTAMLRCHALKCLGETGNASAVELLVRVVREPRSEGTEVERQNAMDVRLAAARALGQYRDPQAEAALFSVMRTEKDIGLRMCAYEALRTTTGKKMPLESKEWDSLPELAAVSLPPTSPETSPYSMDGKSGSAANSSTLTTTLGSPAAATPSNIQPASIQPTTTSSPAGLPSSPVIIPSSLSSKQ